MEREATVRITPDRPNGGAPAVSNTDPVSMGPDFQGHRGSRLVAQAMGMLVFLLGIGVIIFVLLQAFRLYQNPTAGVAGGAVVNPSAVQIGRDFVGLIVRIALLFLGSISGSLIANKGINLYFSALRKE